MKREILFRGKSIETGEWIYGSLIGNDVIVGKIVEFEEDYFCTEFWNKVDPETVGQFTGVTDTNGNKVFEGDIIGPTDFGYYGVVDFDGIIYAQLEFTISDDIEIVGNIHDNPELL